MNTSPDSLFWKRKLAAFLHDSPSKPLDIASHEKRATAALARAGLIDDDGLKTFFDKRSDHTAAAADRIPFPHWSSGARCSYDPEKNPLRHPMGGDTALVRNDFRLTAAGAETVEQANQPGHLDTGYAEGSAEDARSRFFAHWRLWRAHATDAHAGFAALPADTRIPDHTIWTHMGVVSALEGCDGEPALLKLQLGPVQEFIAAARSTRDLWSGSQLLSWLMAAGLARLAELLGPDSVIFPNLWGQPLFDLRFEESIWSKLRAYGQERSAWDGFGYPRKWDSNDKHASLPLHTPNLPNVFLALVPASRAESIAREVERAIREEWRLIANSVLDLAAPLFDLRHATVAADARERYKRTTRLHLDIAWQTFPLEEDPIKLLATARQFLPKDSPEDAPEHNDAVRRVETLVNYFTASLPQEHRDPRYYKGGKEGPKSTLNNLGIAWSLAVALASWQLDATRSLRCFAGSAPSGPKGNAVSEHGGKDALNGRDPMLFGGSEEWLRAIHARPDPEGGSWKKLFRHADEVGAITLIKRLWHLSYLKAEWRLEPHRMPNTYELASGQIGSDDDTDVQHLSEADGKYYAVIAFDGDSIGQWVSGAKTPAFGTQISDHSPKPGHPSPRAYFQELDSKLPDSDRLLVLQRPLSPSYHLQFSETLSNFALHCAPRVVSAYGGKLLYAGGDDVLALVPAPHALACANDLQRVFRGLSPQTNCGIEELSPGFLSVAKDHSANRAIPLLLPGPRSTASVGLALAHFKQPLQDVVREAQRAEKRAKQLEGKHALGITLMKRSGETIEWNTRFDADAHTPDVDTSKGGPSHRGGLLAAQWLLCSLGCNVGSTPDKKRPPTDKVLSARFPHRLEGLLEPYIAELPLADVSSDQLNPLALFERELDHALDQQRGPCWNTPEGRETRERLREALVAYTRDLPGQTATEKFRPVLALLATTAFLARQPEIKA